MGISGVGSAIGLMIAGSGAIGAWKKCFMNNKQAPGTMIVFAGAPLTQTLYGFLLMQQMSNAAANPAKNPWLLFGMGLVCSIAIAASAVYELIEFGVLKNPCPVLNPFLNNLFKSICVHVVVPIAQKSKS